MAALSGSSSHSDLLQTLGFNPYHKWLGLRGDPPFDHYTLLGLSHFEDDPDVISNASDGRMYTIKMHDGKYGAAVAKINGEIALASNCLLDDAKKRAYDEELKSQLESAAPSSNASLSGIGLQPPPAAPPPPAAVPPPPVEPAPPEAPVIITDRQVPNRKVVEAPLPQPIDYQNDPPAGPVIDTEKGTSASHTLSQGGRSAAGNARKRSAQPSKRAASSAKKSLIPQVLRDQPKIIYFAPFCGIVSLLLFFLIIGLFGGENEKPAPAAYDAAQEEKRERIANANRIRKEAERRIQATREAARQAEAERLEQEEKARQAELE